MNLRKEKIKKIQRDKKVTSFLKKPRIGETFLIDSGEKKRRGFCTGTVGSEEKILD